MKNKGFTLIELLAVIVILAIIALIATPIILGIINNAREESKQRTAELIRDEVKLAYTSYLFKVPGVTPEDLCAFMKEKYFAMDGAELGTCASNSVVVTAGGNDYTVTYSAGTATIEGNGIESISALLGSN